MRIGYVATVALALAGTPAFAQITIDGDNGVRHHDRAEAYRADGRQHMAASRRAEDDGRYHAAERERQMADQDFQAAHHEEYLADHNQGVTLPFGH